MTLVYSAPLAAEEAMYPRSCVRLTGYRFARAALVLLALSASAALAQSPQIELENLAEAPFPERLVFSRIGSLSNPPSANGVHDRSTLRIHNKGNASLSISTLPVSGLFQLESPPSLPATIPAGSSLDITVRYVAETGNKSSGTRGIHSGTLTITSNDPSTPSLPVQLSGYWQSVSEGGKEPKFAELVEQVFGYGTDILYTGQQLNNQGRIETVGEEVLSPYWQRADETRPVSVQQLAAYHSCCGSGNRVYWVRKNNSTTSLLFRHAGADGQTVLPRKDGSSELALSEFVPNTTFFGFRVGTDEWSDPTLNNTSNDDCSGGPNTCGHHVRFWPVRDRNGNLVPATYLMTMDFAGINYDFNDNVYLISNILPEFSGEMPAPPTALNAAGSTDDIVLDWANNVEGNLAGYNVYRSDEPGGPYTKLNAGVLPTSDYVDTGVQSGALAFYAVSAVSTDGVESPMSAEAHATRLMPISSFTEIGWGTAASQAYKNTEVQAEVVNGRLYTFGGYDILKREGACNCFTPTERAYVYDPTADAWTLIADLPHTNGGGVTHAGIATDGIDIFLAAGFISNAARTGQITGIREVWRYNVAANTYTRLPDLPANRGAGELQYLRGKLHYFSGMEGTGGDAEGGNEVGDHYVLDYDTFLNGGSPTWTTAAALPNPRHHMGSVVLNNLIYAVGGQRGFYGQAIPQASVHAYDPVTDTWTAVAPLPLARGLIAATIVHEGRIIVMGGEFDPPSGIVDDVTAYDPSTDMWTELTPLPVARKVGIGASLGGNIYYSTGAPAPTDVTYKGVPGGTSSNQPPVASFTAVPESNDPLSYSFDASASADDGTIVSYGWDFGDGATGSGLTTSHSFATAGSYTVTLTLTDDEGATGSTQRAITVNGGIDDFTQVVWSTVAPQPFKNSEAQAEVVNGKLYVFGGFDILKKEGACNCFTPTKRAYVYDPTANTWTAIADLPHTNGGGVTHAGITTDGIDIFLASGYISNAARTGQVFGTKEVWRYNVAANTYTRLPDLPVDRAAGELQYYSGKLHYFGGTNKARTQDVGDHYVLDYDAFLNGGSPTWTTAAALPNPRHHMGSVVLNNLIYVVGGQHAHDAQAVPQAALHVYDPSIDLWTELTPLPLARSHIAAFGHGGRLIVIGGEFDPPNGKVDDVTAYDPSTNTWTELTPLPALRKSGVAGSIGGDLYYTTGSESGPTAITYKGVPDGTSSNQPPVASFTAVPESNDPLSYSFDASASADDGTIVSYGWDFGDGATGSGLTTSHSFATAGSYTVTLTLTDNGGATGTTSQAVSVGAGPSTGPFAESGGLVVMEAENVHENLSRGSHAWAASAQSGAVGSALQAAPNTGTNINTGYATSAPELRFRVEFSTPGTYYVWSRVWAATNNDDSFHAGLDGAAPASADRITVQQYGAWVWTSTTMDSGSRATMQIALAGEHVVNVWMREDGLILDRLLLTTDAAFTPTGAGPAESPRTGSERPSVTGTSPLNGATGVLRDAFIAADVRLPNVGQGIDQSTLNVTNVKLYPTGSPTAPVEANLNTSGGGDAIVLQPLSLLAADTPYTFEVTNGLMDLAGKRFLPFSMSFTTGPTPTGVSDSRVKFEQVTFGGGLGTSGKHSSLAIGPDGRLYATTITGEIKRWDLNPDGTLANYQLITSLQGAEGGNRLAIGLAFDPASTPSDVIVWVSHSTFGFSGQPDWGGKVARLSGPNLETVKNYVVGLPRSIRDHVTNGLAFGPDGALYALQGSNSAMGAPDDAWGNRPERLLTAALLRIDVAAIAGGVLPLNVKTEEGGTYDPFAPGAPVRIFASGLRNAYDLVWHSNGNLYVPTNGSAANGKAPASIPGVIRPDGTPYSGQTVPAIDSVETQNDYLFRVPPPNGDGTWGYNYYGHPNPSRGEFALNGANPTSAADPAQVNRYPVGINHDAAWVGFTYNFGRNISPNGVIEYQSDTFGGALQGKLLVARYSGGDDILGLTPDDASGKIAADGDFELVIEGIPVLNDPLDLTENPANGFLYLSEYGGAGQVSLLRPISNAPPVASFTATPDGADPLTYTFDASASSDDGTIASYAWDFGDGTSGSGLTVGHTYAAAGAYTVTVTVTDDEGATGATNQAINAGTGSSTGPFAESGGLVVTEAENAHENLSRGSHVWVSDAQAGGSATSRDISHDALSNAASSALQATSPHAKLKVLIPTSSKDHPYAQSDASEQLRAAGTGPATASVAPPGSVGSAMEATPNTGTNINTGYATTSPELRWRVAFSTPGTYHVWARVWAATQDDDSFHAGLDGAAPASADRITSGGLPLSQWVWTKATMDGPAATLSVASAGERVVSVWMREDGLFIDRLLLTTDAGYVPSGNGPAESPRLLPGGNQSPVASFTATPDGEAPLDYTFDASASTDDGTITSYAWDFGDGTSGNGVTPSHSFATTGFFTVTLTLTDDEGATGSAEQTLSVSDGTLAVVAEAGTVSVTQSGPGPWQPVVLAHSFTNPVVVMGPLSYNGADPATVRVRNVGVSSFEFQLDEWDYLDGAHTAESLSYLVVEAGTHVLEDGRRLEAGLATVGGVTSAVSFSEAFAVAPVVVSQVVTASGAAAVVTRQQNVTASGFGVFLQEQEIGGAPAPEQVAWVAMEPGMGTTGGVAYESGRTADVVTHTWRGLSFLGGFTAVPVFVAAMQTTDGIDPSGLRYRSLSASGAEVFVEEERSADRETNHTTEVVGYLAVEAGLISAAGGGSARAEVAAASEGAVRDDGAESAAKSAEAEALPEAFALEANYPNPFAGRTTIRFALPEASEVHLEVFDGLGRRVVVLADGAREAGWHEVSFAAAGLPSGLYFYRLQAGAFLDFKKMTLVR